jgi:hypothetical protein
MGWTLLPQIRFTLISNATFKRENPSCSGCLQHIPRRITVGDAILAREADRYAADALIARNTKDFAVKSAAPVLTPEQLRSQAF